MTFPRVGLLWLREDPPAPIARLLRAARGGFFVEIERERPRAPMSTTVTEIAHYLRLLLLAA